MNCSRCASDKIVPNARVLTSESLFKTDDLRVHVKPTKLDPIFAKVSANVCGACGYIELFALEREAFYREWREASEGST